MNSSTPRAVDIKRVKLNKSNPRTIRDAAFNKLVQSIREFPTMLWLRPIVVNMDMMVLGGNMRLTACRKAGLTAVPVVIADLTEDEQSEFIIKDNVTSGSWDFDALAAGWDGEMLSGWGVDMPEFKTVTMDPDDRDDTPSLPSEYILTVRVDNQRHAESLFERLIADGLDVEMKTKK